MSAMGASLSRGGARLSEMRASLPKGDPRLSDMGAPLSRGDASKHEMVRAEDEVDASLGLEQPSLLWLSLIHISSEGASAQGDGSDGATGTGASSGAKMCIRDRCTTRWRTRT